MEKLPNKALQADVVLAYARNHVAERQGVGQTSDMADSNQIATALSRLEPAATDFRDGLKRVMVALAEAAEPGRLFPDVFRFMEENADADFGAPGPIVHTLEKLGGYEEALLDSIRRAPIIHTLWMVNRILNSDVPAIERRTWLDELGRIASNPDVPEHVRDEAQEFLQQQAEGM